MNFEELKERLVSELKQLWERIQDSSLYNQLSDRYQNLNPTKQKLVLVAAVLVGTSMILSIPWGYWDESRVAVDGFESRRDLVRKLLKTSREVAEVPDIPVPPSTDTLTNDIQTYLQSIQLLPEQIVSVAAATAESSLIPAGMASGGVTVNLAQLNLRQIVDVGHKLKSISPSVKMTSMQVFPNSKKPSYFDVNFKLVALSVPEAAPIVVDEAPSPAPRGRTLPRRSRPGSGDDQ